MTDDSKRKADKGAQQPTEDMRTDNPKSIEKKFKYKNALGQKGFILKNHFGGPSVFRIYQGDGEFKDFDILYDDLQVEIFDDCAEFLESEDGTELYLDYSRKVLGKEPSSLLINPKGTASYQELVPEDFSSKNVKERVSIMLDQGILDDFRSRAKEENTDLPALINEALRSYESK